MYIYFTCFINRITVMHTLIECKFGWNEVSDCASSRQSCQGCMRNMDLHSYVSSYFHNFFKSFQALGSIPIYLLNRITGLKQWLNIVLYCIQVFI